MQLSDRAIFNKSLIALRPPDIRLPVILSSMWTKPKPTNVLALNDLTIRMFATHRDHADRSDGATAHTDIPQINDRDPPAATAGHNPKLEEIPEESDNEDAPGKSAENDDGSGEYQCADNVGDPFLDRPNRPVKARSIPGGSKRQGAGVSRTSGRHPKYEGRRKR